MEMGSGDGAIPLAGMAKPAAAGMRISPPRTSATSSAYLNRSPALRPKSWNPFSARPRR